MWKALLLITASAALAADFEVPDKAAFEKLFPAGAKVERLATDLQFIEGPAWIQAGGYLVFSDIPANELKRWDPKSGVTTLSDCIEPKPTWVKYSLQWNDGLSACNSRQLSL